LERYTEQAFGIDPTLVETKRNTIIWSPPGQGKTFTVRNVAKKYNIDYISCHGKTTLNGFVSKIAMTMHREINTNNPIVVWIDDCDSFFENEQSLNFMKNVFDNDQPEINWNVNIGSQIALNKKVNPALAEALEYFRNGDVGVYIDMSRCRFIVTTNKKLASKQDIKKSKIATHEHAVRDRCIWRQFDINNEEAWGWMASVVLSDNVFVNDNFTLTDQQMLQLLNTFYMHWDKLNANSMRTLKQAASDLYNNPNTFADEFQQNYLV
jgi:SpoVK/Ycf46/Vps4 family AAA+-type ATPase